MENRAFYDISPVINKNIAVFPGDTTFEENFLMDMKKGHSLSLSYIKTTAHLGAHTDAPSHYQSEGESMSERSLKYYFGACQVLDVAVGRNQRILVSHLGGKKIEAPRILFKTKTFPDPYRWNGDFASLSAELVNYLAEKKVKLVGIDTPSIDPAEDKVLESHKAVAKNNLSILEGIVLDEVPEGIYDLVALPLKIEGADASPVRAILLR